MLVAAEWHRTLDVHFVYIAVRSKVVVGNVVQMLMAVLAHLRKHLVVLIPVLLSCDFIN